jgi:hypothetical protein
MWSILGLAALLAAPSNALYFYLHAGEEKCFIEELPKDTLVVGMLRAHQITAYRADEILQDTTRDFNGT